MGCIQVTQTRPAANDPNIESHTARCDSEPHGRDYFDFRWFKHRIAWCYLWQIILPMSDTSGDCPQKWIILLRWVRHRASRIPCVIFYRGKPATPSTA